MTTTVPADHHAETVPFLAQVLKAMRGHHYGANEAHLLLELAEHTNGTDGHAWPSLDRLAELVQRERSNVSRAITRLEARRTGVGLRVVRSTGGQHQTNRYVIVFHSATGAKSQRSQQQARNRNVATGAKSQRISSSTTGAKSTRLTGAKSTRESLIEPLNKAAAARVVHPSAHEPAPAAAAALLDMEQRALMAYVICRRENSVVRDPMPWQAKLVADETPRLLEARGRYPTERSICANLFGMTRAQIRDHLEPLLREAMANGGRIEPARCTDCVDGWIEVDTGGVTRCHCTVQAAGG